METDPRLYPVVSCFYPACGVVVAAATVAVVPPVWYPSTDAASPGFKSVGPLINWSSSEIGYGSVVSRGRTNGSIGSLSSANFEVPDALNSDPWATNIVTVG